MKSFASTEAQNNQGNMYEASEYRHCTLHQCSNICGFLPNRFDRGIRSDSSAAYAQSQILWFMEPGFQSQCRHKLQHSERCCSHLCTQCLGGWSVRKW